MNGFLPYQSFATEVVAQPLLELLERHRVPVETGWAKPDFDVSMANNATDTRFVVRLQPADFERARELEEQGNETLMAEAPFDHYLFDFDDDELFDILVKPDEWNSYDVSLARHILRQRGREVSPDTVRLLRRNRLAEMTKPEPSQSVWLLFRGHWRHLGHAHWVALALPQQNPFRRYSGAGFFAARPGARLSHLAAGGCGPLCFAAAAVAEKLTWLAPQYSGQLRNLWLSLSRKRGQTHLHSF